MRPVAARLREGVRERCPAAAATAGSPLLMMMRLRPTAAEAIGEGSFPCTRRPELLIPHSCELSRTSLVLACICWSGLSGLRSRCR